MRRSTDFAQTLRSGARSSGRYLVVHARPATSPTPAEPARVGFVVSKAVGNAVQRNRVKRRLRASMSELLASLPTGAAVVVRAKEGATEATFAQLRDEVGAHLMRALRRANAGSPA